MNKQQKQERKQSSKMLKLQGVNTQDWSNNCLGSWEDDALEEEDAIEEDTGYLGSLFDGSFECRSGLAAQPLLEGVCCLGQPFRDLA